MYKGLDIEKGLVYSKNRQEASVPEASVSEGDECLVRDQAEGVI